MGDNKEMGHLAGGKTVRGLTTVKDHEVIYDRCKNSFPCMVSDVHAPYIVEKKKVRKPK